MSNEYKLRNRLYKTDHSELYEAIKKSGKRYDELRYIAKRYIDIEDPDCILEYEKRTTQIIENSCRKSVLIPVFDLTTIEGTKYVIMQLKNNGVFLENLRPSIDEGNYPIKDLLNIAYELFLTVKALHDTGWLHLDIHPGNIFLENASQEDISNFKVKLIDFSGAMKISTVNDSYDDNRVQSMTEGYSAPEVVYQKTHSFDTSTDIFSVIAVINWIFFGETFVDSYGNYIQDHYLERYPEIKMKVFSKYYNAFITDGLSYEQRFRLKDEEDCLDAINQLILCEDYYFNSNYNGIISLAFDIGFPLEEMITDEISFNEMEYRRAAAILYDNTNNNHVNYEYCYYYFRCLWECKDNIENHISNNEIARLIGSGIASCNMVSDIMLGTELFYIFQHYKDSIPIDEYLTIQLRAASMVADKKYGFAEALILASESVEGLRTIRDARKSVSEEMGIKGEVSFKSVNLAKAYSAKACYLIYSKSDDIDLVCDNFIKALDEFGDLTQNKEITISHILHFGIELVSSGINKIKGITLFEQYDNKYFGVHCKNIRECWLMLTDRDTVDIYKLYAFFKAVYYLYLKNVDDDLVCEFINYLDNKKFGNKTEHPVEMIYKYVGLIVADRMKSGSRLFDNRQVDNLFLKSLTSNKFGQINMEKDLTMQMLISYHTIYIYNNLIGQEEENNELMKKLLIHAKRSGWSLLERILKESKMDDVLFFEYA